MHFSRYTLLESLLFLTIKLWLKIDGAASTGCHGKYKKYVGVP
jgi:hypothetical protein